MKKNRIIRMVVNIGLATVLSVCTVIAIPSLSVTTVEAKEEKYIDNSDVMPLYVSDQYVNLEDAGEGQPDSPAWLKTAIMAEVRLDTASTDGTLEGCIPMLDHYQEMGVNALWLTPVHHMGDYLANPNGYNNYGIHTIDPNLTGTTDYEQGWESFGWFVREAHKRNIRILLDIVPWGVTKNATLPQEHPELFQHDKDGNLVWNNWGGWSYDWESEAFRDWFKEKLLYIIDVADLDGIRADLDPAHAGYEFWDKVRAEALDMGHKIMVMSEHSNEREDDYDLEQFGVMCYENWNYDKQYFQADAKEFFLEKNIVDCVKNGTYIGSQLMQLLSDSGHYRFYTYNFSNHDHGYTRFRGNLLNVGYQGIFSPFIPLWYMGDEIGTDVKNESLYYAVKGLDYSLLDDPENRHFYETLKKYIRIRRTYTEIFEHFESDGRQNRICEVQVSGLEKYVAYARYDDNGNAIIIVPNANVKNVDAKMSIMVPFEETGLDNYKNFTVTDLMNNKELAHGNASQAGIFTAQIPEGELGIYLVHGTGKKDVKDAVVYNDTIITEDGELTIIENPIVGKKTVTNTHHTNVSGTLSWVFWVSLIGSILVCMTAASLLAVYLIRMRKRRKEV